MEVLRPRQTRFRQLFYSHLRPLLSERCNLTILLRVRTGQLDNFWRLVLQALTLQLRPRREGLPSMRFGYGLRGSFVVDVLEVNKKIRRTDAEPSCFE